MPTIVVEDFLFDDENEDKLARHGVSLDDALEVLESPYRVMRNRKAGRATHMVVGRTRSGRCLIVCVEPTHDRGVWRPVTAWFPDSRHQLAWCP